MTSRELVAGFHHSVSAHVIDIQIRRQWTFWSSEAYVLKSIKEKAFLKQTKT